MQQKEGPPSRAPSAVEGPPEAPPAKPYDMQVVRRFLGEWDFDRSRSTSIAPVSEHLGVPWLVRNAVEKLNPRIEYTLEKKEGQLEFAITTKLTAGVSKTVRLNLSGCDVEAEDADVGAWRSISHFEGNKLKTIQTNKQQKAKLIEIREVVQEGEGPESDALWYRVTLQKEGLPNEISSVRVFKRVSGPPPLACQETEQTAQSDASQSTVSSPAKTLEAEQQPQEPPPAWRAFRPREKAVSEELQWAVDHLDDPSVFSKAAGRGFDTYQSYNYKFNKSEGQRTAEGDTLPVLGVGRINLGKVELQKCINYLNKPENKMIFDSSTSKVISVATEENFSLVYQAFKGQWGFAGREFVLACWETKVNEDRTILSCESVDWEERIEGQIDGLVRANLLLGGYDLQRHPNGDVFLSFAAQADLKTAGVPEWINTRVKAEQLTVVKNIKKEILKL